MSRNSPATKQQIDERPPSRGGPVDGRSPVGIRRRELINIFAAALGGPASLSEGQRIDVRRAAELVALSEAARARAMREGTADASELSTMVRLESTAVRAVRILNIKHGPSRVVPLRERLRGGAG